MTKKYFVTVVATVVDSKGNAIAAHTASGEVKITLDKGDDKSMIEQYVKDEVSTAFLAAQNTFEDCIQGELTLSEPGEKA